MKNKKPKKVNLKSTSKDATFEEMKGTYPSTVYKYRRWKNEYDKRVLTQKELFFASPRSFEDPLDCKQTIDYSSLTDEDKFEWGKIVVKQKYPHLGDDLIPEVTRRFLLKAPINDPIEVKKIQESQLERYFDITGVLSLSFNPSSNRMWDKYGDQHKGFCVGFDSQLLFESRIGGTGAYVEYVDELHEIYPEPKMDFHTQAYHQIFYKLKKWEFEEEYRLHIIRGHKLRIEDRRQHAPVNAFKELIIGKKMPKEDFEELINELPDDLKHVKIIKLEN